MGRKSNAAGVYNASGITLSDGDDADFQFTVTGGLITAGAGTGGVTPVSPTAYPNTATPITASSGNVANASAVATLAASATKITYITGFEVTGSGATLGSAVTITVVGTITGTLSYTTAAIAGALLGNVPLIVEYPVAIPGSAINTAIVVTVPALGAGNTNSTVVAHGYQLQEIE